jgi:putative DNA primase/helicase
MRRDAPVPFAASQILGARKSDEWPEPHPLSGSLPPVESLTDNLLPVGFREFVSDASERMQVPPELIAIPLVVAFAGVIGRRARIQPKRADTGWIVTPNLWGAVVAPPGYLKSPALHLATQPLVQIERQWHDEHEYAMAEYAKGQSEQGVRQSAWKDKAKQAIKKGESPPEQPSEVLRMPTEKRLLVNDATPERLHQILADNPAGVLYTRDELTGWLAELDKPGRENERAFFLECWNGAGAFTIDRIGRGSIRAEACCVSLFGGIQPGRLRPYLADAVKDGPNNDGLLQRLQLTVWPDPQRNWTYTDHRPKTELIEHISAHWSHFAAISAERPLRFKFDDAAQDLFIQWLCRLEYQLRDETEHPAVISHLSKYRSLMPSLAALFELTDSALQPGEDCHWISLSCAEQAVAWCDFLQTHMRRVYSCIVSAAVRAANELAAKIKAGKLGDSTFRLRQVYFKGWSGLDTPDAVRQALNVLEDGDWVRRVSESDSIGRPPEEFEINPKIFKMPKHEPSKPSKIRF